MDGGGAGGRSTRPIALQRVDLASGQIIAHAAVAGWPEAWPSADVRGIFVSALATNNPTAPGLTLSRLDPVTLAPAAQRTLPGRASAVVWPRVPGSQLVSICF